MKPIKIKKPNPYGVIGILIYLFLCIPQLRSALFGEKAKILDIFSGELSETATGISRFGQATLLIPYHLNNAIFRHFEISNVNLLVIVIMLPLVYKYFSYAKNLKSLAILGLFFLPAPLLFLSTFNKEILLVGTFFFTYATYTQTSMRTHALFLAYSLTMRPYLSWIPLIIGAQNLKKITIRILAIFSLALTIPQAREILYQIFNRRLAEKGYDANSEIVQTVFVQSLADIFVVLYQVLPQVLFPFLVNPSIKTLFFQTYIAAFIFFSIKASNRHGHALILAFFMYTLLDPDLGAFLRHISSFFPIIPIMLCMKKPKHQQPVK
ncbi:hypothetical protein ACNFCJ_01545 [Pseudomonas sp. NY15364]|uniref:hypothetical protein n=1 Tax=Pseudomonas sp. NY15364 TaxID=3400353 RepID=UPI003A89E864